MARNTAQVNVETATIHTIFIDMPLDDLQDVKSGDTVKVILNVGSAPRLGTPKTLTYREVVSIAQANGNAPLQY